MRRLLLIIMLMAGCSQVQEQSQGDHSATKKPAAIPETLATPSRIPEAIESHEEPLSVKAQSSPAKKTAYALIIANGNYSEETGWSSISSLNDIPLVTEALHAQGFEPKNIFLVKDADYETMKNALANFKKKVRAGDVAVIHYSGHGQQIEDDNGDEADGLDEALVPVDAHKNFEAGVYEGEKHFRDDEFGAILTAIRQQLTKTGNLLVTVDACHSGTATRGSALARGTGEPLVRPGFKRTGERDENAFGISSDKDDLAPLTCIFGTQPGQLNYEYQISRDSSVGSLTYAFSKSFARASSKLTYRALFEDIKSEMSRIAPRQNPMSEGMLEDEILGGNIKGGLKNLSGQAQGLLADFEIILIREKAGENWEGNNPVSFYAGERIKIKIRNQGDEQVYFSLLDFQPDGIINTLLPMQGVLPETCLLQPGQTLMSEEFVLEPPYGIETFRLIAARKPVTTESIRSSEVHVYEQHFEIKPPSN